MATDRTSMFSWFLNHYFVSQTEFLLHFFFEAKRADSLAKRRTTSISARTTTLDSQRQMGTAQILPSSLSPSMESRVAALVQSSV